MRALRTCVALLAPSVFGAGCTAAGDQPIALEDLTKPGDGKWDTSVEAVFVDFEFDGELLAGSSFNPRSKIEDQLLYTVGQLNGERSVGRLDRLELTKIESEPAGDRTRITYSARLPVAWGRRSQVPTDYTFQLPRDVSFGGLQSFTEAYKNSCVDSSAHDVTSGSMWYYYRPEAWNCDLDPDDVYEIQASVSLSTINTSGKYPEYDKVYEDGVLRVVAIFGKYEEGATSNGDAGISAYNRFVRDLKDELEPLGLTTTPAEVPFLPGVDVPDIRFEADLGDGKRIEVTALLIDGVQTAGLEFDARYAALSADADLIAYNGHSGLGSNIRALAGKGQWVPGQYVMVFMNGCDTYAYVDDAILRAHADINPDDPTGTRYVDMITNAMPAFFHSTAPATMAFVRGLMSHDQPLTYEKIFTAIDSAQVVLVSGEQDNTFHPGGGGGDGDEDWSGLEESGAVAAGEEHRFATPSLPAGRYLFELSGTEDADLYVRVGTEPTTALFDCRPYKYGSHETCSVELNAPAPVHVMVRGWAASSDYTLVGRISD